MSIKSINKVIVSGIQPSGTLHLGNYLGAVKEWIKLTNNYSLTPEYKENKVFNSNTRHKILFFLADYHSLTSRLAFEKSNKESNVSTDSLEDLCFKTLACLIACGLDYNKCTIFLQSSIPYHTELQWILSCITPHSWLNTMIQYKEKKIDSNGIYSYPILMAADVLLYKATHVPVGVDQMQHLELIGKMTERINKVAKFDLFEIPKTIISNHPKVMSLSNGLKKMSKSEGGDNSVIFLTDSREEIEKKITRAKTDSVSTIFHDSDKRPEITNLISIYSVLSELSVEKVEKKFESANTYEFKLDLSELINSKISIISEKANKLIKSEKDLLLDILREGELIAGKIAKDTIIELKDRLQILTFPSIKSNLI